MRKIYLEKRSIIICSEDDTVLSDPNAIRFSVGNEGGVTGMIEMFEISDTLQRIYIPTGNIEETYARIRREFLEVNACGGLVENNRGDFLMINRNTLWDLPKGHQDPGEDISTTALREVQEETGIDNLELKELICITDHCYKRNGIWHLVQKHRITTFCAPPTIYRFLIQEDLSDIDFSSLTHCSTAGEPLSEEVFNKWKEITGLEITEGFGQSETTVSLFNFEGEKIKPGSIGKPCPYYNVCLLDENNEEVGDAIVGQLCFKLDMETFAKTNGRFPGLVCEYYGEPEKTAEAFHDGYYYTGDNAWRDEDGYYWFVGRCDDVIKCSGYRIGTFEVESVLMKHPAVVECAVTGAPDPVRGQVVKATIVLAKDWLPGNADLVKDIQRFVKETTAPYKYPRIVEFVEALPKTTSGKIMRKAIRANDAEKNTN